MAGLLIGNSAVRAVTLRATLPIQSVLMVVFFLSIGLLLDLRYVWQELPTVLAFLVSVVVVKTVSNVACLRLLGEPWERAFPAGLVMGQIGEFSFVLAAIGAGGGLLSPDDYRLAIAVIVLSLLASPLWLMSVRRFHHVAAGGVLSMREALREVYGTEISTAARIGGAQQEFRDANRSGTQPSRQCSRDPPALDQHQRRLSAGNAHDELADTELLAIVAGASPGERSLPCHPS